MIGQYNYTVILTYANLVSGSLGIFLALSAQIEISLVFLVISGICDLFDGIVARTKKNRNTQEKRYGIQIDSLADLISFCLLPAIISFSLENNSTIDILLYTFLILTGLIRLAYFNITELEISEINKKRKYYEGLPVTSTAITIPFIFFVSTLTKLDLKFTIMIGLVFSGILFISKVRIPKLELKFKRRKVSEHERQKFK